MKNLLLFFILTFNSIILFSQKHGNEWIDYSQKYYSFGIYRTGIYKLDYNALSNSGIAVTSFSSNNIQIFGREREVPLYVYDGGDSQIDPGDYILFYAEKNDSWLDSTLYEDSTWIGNPSYSLFNDTINYFFTWNSSNSNLRFAEETTTDFSNYTPSNFILQKVETSYSNYYNEGAGRNSLASSSFYKPGEGYGYLPQNGVNGTGEFTLSLSANTPSPYTGSDAPNCIFKGISTTNSEADYTGAGNHHLRWKIGASSQLLFDQIYTDYEYANVNSLFSSSLLTNGSTPIKWSIIDDQGALTDFQSLNYWSITYPKMPTLNGNSSGTFYVKNNSIQSKIRLDLVNVAVSNPIVLVFDKYSAKKVLLTAFNSGYTSLFSNSISGLDQKVIIQDLSASLSITSLKPVNGNGLFTNYSLVNSEAALLMIYPDILKTQSLEYQLYRKSVSGGGYNAILADVEELYLQFGGGIRKHINGIRRFSFFMYNKSISKPIGLFLIGKGVVNADDVTIYGTNGSRNNTTSYAANLIPTFGQPASDVSITADFKHSKFSPLIPTGRVTVSSNQELQNYLDKIKEYDANQNQTSIYSSSEKDWQKQIVHFGGGITDYQQSTIQGFMNSMEGTIENANFGGNVYKLYKNSSAPFDPQVLGNATERIKRGVSIINFFGHTSPIGFEINIDDPNNWNNKGKYPIMISNSCYAGNMFSLSSLSIATNSYINVKNGGAIAFIGSVAEGIDQPLGQFTNELYKQFSVLNYGKTLSEQIKATVENFQNTNNNGLLIEAASTQMNLNGDPLIKLNWHTKPEIELTSDNVWFTPKNFDLSVDSIEVHFILKNLGRSIVDTFDVEIRRDFPMANVDSVYTIQIPNLDYIDTVHFKFPLQNNIGVGLNNITLSVDIPSEIPEQYDEINNNKVVSSLFVNIDGILPLLPIDYAIVPSDSITLIASTINPIASIKNYRFEIDTTDTFNSSFHKYALISGLGGVKEVFPSDWKLVSSNQKSKLIGEDSVVYFWRVSLDSTTFDWRERSFQYIKGVSGWGQDNFFQFKNNGFTNLLYDRNTRTKKFAFDFPDSVSLFLLPGVGKQTEIRINGQRQDYNTCNGATPALNVVVFDVLTNQPWGTRYVPTGSFLNNNFGNSNDNGTCRQRPSYFFTFPQTSSTYLNAFQDMVLNKIPDSSYVFIYTTNKANFNAWDTYAPNLYAMFNALGSDSIKTGRNNYSFAMFYKKGDVNSLVEKFAQTASENLFLSEKLKKRLAIGSEVAPLIGPSSLWSKIHWKQDSKDLVNLDSTMLHIKVYDIHKSFQYQIDTIFSHRDSIVNLNSLVNASNYPYIGLSADYSDKTNLTPAQIDRWNVVFDLLPEAAIDGSKNYTWIPNKDTLSEGEDIRFAVDIKNIYTLPMDSLLVNYWIEDQSHKKHIIPLTRRKPLLVNDVIRDTIKFSTIGLTGMNSLWMEVNPYVNGSLFITDQPEQEHINNILQVPFFVNGDNINPLLDVTFDGRHILNGDIVSPKSEILITLKDENQFLLMDNISDTTRFGIYLTNPKGVQTRIPFVNGKGETILQWIPADQTSKKFKIIYPALFEENGKYTLMVQGTDRSGNLSGDLQYKISFEIVKESAITYLMNYPNPFSTSTRFVFTLTGSSTPENVIIQIMTVTGKVVREITETELGRIYIGRNVTEFEWNGTDEFGDQLANGVYLYRVKAQINGEDVKHKGSGADSFFTKDFGKMYIIR